MMKSVIFQVGSREYKAESLKRNALDEKRLGRDMFVGGPGRKESLQSNFDYSKFRFRSPT